MVSGNHAFSRFIEEKTWDDIKEKVAACDPATYEIIESLSLTEEHTLYQVNYRYGDFIYHEGLFYLPDIRGRLAPLVPGASNFCQKMMDDLNYQALPLGLLLNNSFEVFNTIDERVCPLAFRHPGLHLGIWETLSPASANSVTAGARSAFMLPKISEAGSHRRLRPLGAPNTKPMQYQDQWHVFKQLAHHVGFSEKWGCEILFFSRKWMDSMREDPAWARLLAHTTKKAWEHTEPKKTHGLYVSAWDSFIHHLNQNRIKYTEHTLLTFKHLIDVCFGVVPAFKPIRLHEYHSCGPFKEIIKIYLEVYGLKHYIPTLMHADFFDPVAGPVYYSLQTPSSSGAITKSQTISSLKQELFDLIALADLFMEALTRGVLGPGSHHLHALFSRVQLDFFHPDASPGRGVHPLHELVEEDPSFLCSPFDMSGREFCYANAFMKGVVRVSSKD